MANFESAFQRLMRDEGITLTNDPTDKGGQTFCGISRKSHPKWTGWKFIDAGDTPPTEMVREFYEQMYWLPVRGNDITSQRIAEVIFGQYVNMGTQAIKLAQQCAGVVADGKIGFKSLAAINAIDAETFLMRYALANIARYHAIGMKDKTQRKFWPGWIKRGLDVCKEAA